jgi:peptidoglycan hydrolase-like protein with peptidoglycan-binding domain
VSKFICSLAACAVLAFAGTAQAGVIEKGDRGAKVERVQRALGLTPADGVFGKQTRRAVKRFQRRHGLTPDGIVGPATLRALGIGKAREARTGSNPAALEEIARCESGGNPKAVSPDGRYRGKYQFTRATWRALGGKGDPAKAPEAEQDARARSLYEREGGTPWPACARAAR